MLSAPITWHELAGRTDVVGLHRRNLGVMSARLERRTPASRAFASGEQAIPAVATLLGPEACAKLLRDVAPRWQEPVATLANVESDVGALEALSFAGITNAAECCGVSPYRVRDLPIDPMLRAIERHAARFNAESRLSAAFFALGAGRPDLAAVLAQGAPPSGAFEPGRTFAYAVHGFLVYMANAMLRGVPPCDVQPAFLVFVARFPPRASDGRLGWHDLMWAARVYYHHFARRPLGEVASALAFLVRTMAADGA
jgi:hypothetical protein